MPVITQILCPTDGLQFANFLSTERYHYRTENGEEFPLEVAFAWCNGCEHFVECERLPEIDELQSRLSWLRAMMTPPRSDAAQGGRQVPAPKEPALSHQMLSEIQAQWTAALHWRHNRLSPPRCLECGASFNIIVLTESEPTWYPAGRCQVMARGVGRASVSEFPDHIFFDSEGFRIAQESHAEYRNHRQVAAAAHSTDEF